MSYGEQFVLAEEIGREVARNISIPSSPDIIVKTEETRPTTASIINHNLHDANKWYEIKLSRELITWQIRARQNVDIRYSYSPSHATWFTLRSGEILSADVSPDKDINAIYVMSEESEIIVELEYWQR